MANLEHLDILKQGVDVWNQWRKDHPELQPDLSHEDFHELHLEGVNLKETNLEGANLQNAHFERANLSDACLERANLHLAFFDNATRLNRVNIGNKKQDGATLADVHWGGVNLAVVNWASIKTLGDEQKARQIRPVHRFRYRAAARAYRQLAMALRDQGLNEEADYFAYRGQLLQRIVWRQQRRWLKYSFSWFLSLLAGYGYRPLRSVLWYLFIILGFAFIYYTFGHLTLWPPDAFIYSLTSFHGRGFFPGFEEKPSLHDPLIIFAAFEAVIGLFIEISFIATFTKRFFGS